MEQARQALAQTAPDQVDLRATAAALIAMNLEWAGGCAGNIAEPIRLLDAAAGDCQAVGAIQCALLSLSQLPQLLFVQGQLHRAADSIEQTLHLAAQQEGLRVPLMGTLYVTKGLLHFEWNRLEEATRWTWEGIQLAQTGRDPSALGLGVIMLVRVHLARGDVERA